MKVSSIDIMRLAIPFDDGSVVREDVSVPTNVGTGYSSSKAMQCLLVRITADDGTVGWGEAFGHMITPATFVALKEGVGAFFQGREIDINGSGIEEVMDAAARHFHIYGRTGPVVYALSGIDIALWDIKAKRRNLPLYQLLGGRKNTFDAYASLVAYDEIIDDVVRNAIQAYDDGYRHIKLHERTYETIAAVRGALPAEVSLRIDFNCPWLPSEARALTDRLKTLNLYWFEEPIWPPDDFFALAELRKSGIKIAAGENASGLAGFELYLEKEAVDFIQPSVTKLGGISAMLKAFNLAKNHPSVMQPHCFYMGPGFLATAHLMSLTNEALFEVPYLRFEQYLCGKDYFQPTISLQSEPGLGFSPTDEILDRYTIDRHTI